MKKQTLKVTMLIISMLTVFTLGATIGTSSDGLQKVSAYLNHTVSLKLDGKNIELQDTPVNYAGKNYLPIAEMAKLLELDVNWNEEELTIELMDDKKQETATRENFDGELYYSSKDIETVNYINLLEGNTYVHYHVDYRGLEAFIVYDDIEYPLSSGDMYTSGTGNPYFKQEYLSEFFPSEFLNKLPLYERVGNNFNELVTGASESLEKERRVLEDALK